MKKRSVAARFISLGIAVVLLIVGISVGFKMDVLKILKMWQERCILTEQFYLK